LWIRRSGRASALKVRAAAIYQIKGLLVAGNLAATAFLPT
jgi:hypothetical protein